MDKRTDKKQVRTDVIDTSKKQVDKKVVDKLVNPSPLFKKFEPTPDKIKAFARHLMDNKLSLSDEYRNYDIIYAIINKYMSSPDCIFYEIGDMDGVIGFTDILIGWKAHAIFELLNPEIWSKQLVRESRDLFDLIMDVGKLKRVGSQTADKRVRHMSEMIGFHVEGIQAGDFSWNKELYDVYLIGRIRRQESIRPVVAPEVPENGQESE